MRRSHWWGAAACAGVLVSVAFVAPAAVAAPAAPQRAVAAVKAAPQAKPKPKPPVKNVRGNSRGNRHHHPHGRRPHPHPYPANGTPSVHIAGPNHWHPGRTLTVTTKVTINKTAFTGAKVGLYGSLDGKTWKLVATTTTDKNGGASFSYYPRHDVILRIGVAGKDGVNPAQSVNLVLKKK